MCPTYSSVMNYEVTYIELNWLYSIITTSSQELTSTGESKWAKYSDYVLNGGFL